METNRITTGDSMVVLDELDAESVHAVVTDPPYGLAFMGRDWDDFDPREYQEWCENWAKRAKRVLKPGGHLLAFSGNRTHHRLFSGVEDAGFEVRDTVTWHYGSGFPKALDVAKELGEGSEDWAGWKTCLKPATEFVVVARKQLSEGTVAENILEHGTGALNIGECRLAYDGEVKRTSRKADGDEYHDSPGEWQERGRSSNRPSTPTEEGRYPSNVAFDEVAAKSLDTEVGETPGQGVGGQEGHTGEQMHNEIYGKDWKRTAPGYDDRGGPSRYFYTSKATRAERTLDGRIENAHPTVKPADLMEWLVKLVTAEGQLVLDPFCGSGTTCRAAKDLNRDFIGIEMQDRWADVARVRCGMSPNDPANVRADDSPQSGLEVYQ